MTEAEFVRACERVSREIGAYWEGLAGGRGPSVLSSVRPGEILEKLPLRAPEVGQPLDEAGMTSVLEDVSGIIMPGITHWQHPSFFAFFPANASYPAMLGELLCAGLGVQGMLWATSPACTELETRVLDWLGQALALPASMLSTSGSGGGVLQGTASEAVLAAIVAGRARALRAWKQRRQERPFFTLYTSEQAHSSIVKAAMVAGLADDADDRTHVRLVPVDRGLRMRADALCAMLREDVARGRLPCFVGASVGTTSTTAIDDVGAIVAEVARACAPVRAEFGVLPWVHVDAAHAGAACICPEFQGWLAGLEHADSFCMNPHKWLLTNFDCDCFWTSDRAALVASMSISPAYLRNAQSDAGSVIDYRDWHVPLGRRFRALKLWLVMRHYGLEGLRAFVRSHVLWATELEERVRADARWSVVAPRTMNLVCLAVARRAGEGLEHRNARTKAVMDALNAGGSAYCTHTLVPSEDEDEKGGKVFALRVAIGATLTRRGDVVALWEELKKLEREQASAAGGGGR
jgi:aromatic-L-amino-acid decarboxylase